MQIPLALAEGRWNHPLRNEFTVTQLVPRFGVAPSLFIPQANSCGRGTCARLRSLSTHRGIPGSHRGDGTAGEITLYQKKKSAAKRCGIPHSTSASVTRWRAMTRTLGHRRDLLGRVRARQLLPPALRVRLCSASVTIFFRISRWKQRGGDFSRRASYPRRPAYSLCACVTQQGDILPMRLWLRVSTVTCDIAQTEVDIGVASKMGTRLMRNGFERRHQRTHGRHGRVVEPAVPADASIPILRKDG